MDVLLISRAMQDFSTEIAAPQEKLPLILPSAYDSGRGSSAMKRYIVTNQSSRTTHALFNLLPEAIASAVKLQDEGSRVLIVDAQGSGVIMAGHFDVREAEGYLGRSLGSEEIANPVPVAEIIEAAKLTAPPKHAYHWDVGSSDIR